MGEGQPRILWAAEVFQVRGRGSRSDVYYLPFVSGTTFLFQPLEQLGCPSCPIVAAKTH